MITRIKNYSLEDIKAGMLWLLDLSAHSELVRNHAVKVASWQNDKISAVYNWVKWNVEYVSDPIGPDGNIELFISPVKQIEWYNEGKHISGDCDDHALLLTALYRTLGISSNVLIIDSGYGFDHAYCQVWSEALNQYISADTTAKYPLGWVISYHKKIII